MKPIPTTPALPNAGRARDVTSLTGFDQDLTKAIFNFYVDIARRLNEMLPKDGSEPMTGDLNMGGFSITNLQNITVTGVATFNGGATWGSVIAASPDDLSNHIALYGTNYGISISLTTMNFVVGTSASFSWRDSGGERMSLNSSDQLTLPQIRLTSTGDVTLSSTGHGFQIGPDSGVNLVADNNEIQARNNGAANGLQINAEGGTVTFHGNVAGLIDAQGGQIQFPATQVPASGVNVLDDYEEGTWTPAITFTTNGDLSVVYSVQVGRYIKVGKMVTIWCRVTTSTFTWTTATGEMRITGLPFTSVTATNAEFTGSVEMQNFTFAAGRTYANAQVISNASYFRVVQSGSATTRTAINATNTTSGTNVVFAAQITYEASA